MGNYFLDSTVQYGYLAVHVVRVAEDHLLLQTFVVVAAEALLHPGRQSVRVIRTFFLNHITKVLNGISGITKNIIFFSI